MAFALWAFAIYFLVFDAALLIINPKGYIKDIWPIFKVVPMVLVLLNVYEMETENDKVDNAFW